MAWRYCYKDVLPFTALVTMDCANVGLNTLFKAATMKGMSNQIVIVCSYGIAALLLLPAPFFSFRSRVLPPLSTSIICKLGLLGLIGSTSQIMDYIGIKFSSPALASAISNLTPAFTFILAIIFRIEKRALKRASSKAKVIGTIVSIIGAFVVPLYQGPSIVLDQPQQNYLGVLVLFTLENQVGLLVAFFCLQSIFQLYRLFFLYFFSFYIN